MPITSFFVHPQPPKPVIAVVTPATSTASIESRTATSSPPIAPLVANIHEKISASVTISKKKNHILPVAFLVPGNATSSVSVSTSTPPVTIGTTTLAVRSVPLLSGGTVHAGEAVPISYLQITNTGSAGAHLTGFWVSQEGSAPTESIIGLTTVDDRGGSRGSIGGVEGAAPFQNGSALVPTDAYFAPGQMRLFTIKAIMSHSVTANVGTDLMLDVSSLVTTAGVQGQFPIRGTTWTISL
jgi:hypothetical protein